MGGEEEDVGGGVEALDVLAEAEHPDALAGPGGDLLRERALAGDQEDDRGTLRPRRLGGSDRPERILALLELGREQHRHVGLAESERVAEVRPPRGRGRRRQRHPVGHHDEAVVEVGGQRRRQILVLVPGDADRARGGGDRRSQPAPHQLAAHPSERRSRCSPWLVISSGRPRNGGAAIIAAMSPWTWTRSVSRPRRIASCRRRRTEPTPRPRARVTLSANRSWR